MVTGVETAGLVLAVLPLLIEALSVYKSGLEKTGILLNRNQKRYKLKVERLRTQLLAHRASLHNKLEILIRRAAPDEDVPHIPEEYNNVLWNGPLAEKIRAYLLPNGVFEAFQATFNLYEIYLKEIAEQLVSIFRPSRADKKDLKALLDANMPNEEGRYHFRQRLGFIMSEASIDELLKNLGDSTMTLRDFIDDSEDWHQFQRSNEESNEAKQKKTTNSLNVVRKHANALFRAIICGWSETCHERYNAMICLEPRCQETRHALQAATQGSASGTRFTLLFSWLQQTTPDIISWHETSVMTIEEDSSRLLRRKSPNSSMRRPVTIQRAPNVVVTSPETSGLEYSTPVEVTDICKALEQARYPVFQLSSDNRLFLGAAKSTNKLNLIEHGQHMTSLDAFLNDRKQMYPDDRMKLAVNLAASLLQYNLTPWLQRCWTNKTIHFVLQPRALSGIDIDHPLVLKHFDDHRSDTRQELPEDDPELALMELGILLLEIWTMKTFERWVKDMDYALDAAQLEDRDFRHIYAMKWLRSVKAKLLPNYYEVVSICFTPATFHQLEASWEDAEFRVTVYRTIVEPLLIWKK